MEYLSDIIEFQAKELYDIHKGLEKMLEVYAKDGWLLVTITGLSAEVGTSKWHAVFRSKE